MALLHPEAAEHFVRAKSPCGPNAPESTKATRGHARVCASVCFNLTWTRTHLHADDGEDEQHYKEQVEAVHELLSKC